MASGPDRRDPHSSRPAGRQLRQPRQLAGQPGDGLRPRRLSTLGITPSQHCHEPGRSCLVRLAVISDVHFGDDLCTLVTAGADGQPTTGPAYLPLRRALGRVDYLVLLGDILDFSVASYEDAYRAARAFFMRVQEDELAQEIVYVPGNHDFDIWHTVEHQVNVINQLKQGQLPRAFRRSVPGVLDDRASASCGRLVLPDVVPRPEWHENRSAYGNLFLDHITRRWDSDGRRPSGRRLTV